MGNRILVLYGSYRSDRMGIRLAHFIVEGFAGRGDDVDQPARNVSTPPTTTAVHFDLDRGVPMPPDARVGKPAY